MQLICCEATIQGQETPLSKHRIKLQHLNWKKELQGVFMAVQAEENVPITR